jgi:hypothetical protein
LALDIQPVRPEQNPVLPLITVTLELTVKQALALAKDKDNGEISLRVHPQAPAGKKGGDLEKPKDSKKGPDKEK